MTATASAPANQRLRQWIWTVLRVVFVVLIFWFLFRNGNITWVEVWAHLQSFNLWWLSLGSVVWLFSLVIASVRWKAMVNLYNSRVTVLDLTALNLIGVFYATFLPGMASGDVIKGVYLARDEATDKVLVMSSAIMERLIGLTVNGLVALVALAFSPTMLALLNLPRSWVVGFIALTLIGIAVGLMVTRWIAQRQAHLPKWVRVVADPLVLYISKPRALVVGVIASVVYFGVWSASLWMYGIASGIGHLGYFTFLLLLAVINVIQFLPISINGLGVREATLVTILAVYGVDEAQAVAFSLLIPLIGLVAAAMGGILTLIDYRPIQSPS